MRVAVRDTGATHRQVKARGRSLLESLKSISRGMPSRRGRRWRQRVDPSSSADDAVAPTDDDVLHANAQWGVRLSARKHKRMLEGLAANAELEASGSTKRGKAQETSKPAERLLRRSPRSCGVRYHATSDDVRGATEGSGRAPRARAVVRAKDAARFRRGSRPSLWAARRVFGGGFG